MTVVHNLRTGEEKVYDDSIPLKDAVIIADLQMKGDFQTWTYKEKCDLLRHLVREGDVTYTYGDWAIHKPLPTKEVMVAKWRPNTTRSKRFIILYQRQDGSFYYNSDNGGGTLPALASTSKEEAIAYMERNAVQCMRMDLPSTKRVV